MVIAPLKPFPGPRARASLKPGCPSGADGARVASRFEVGRLAIARSAGCSVPRPSRPGLIEARPASPTSISYSRPFLGVRSGPH